MKRYTVYIQRLQDNNQWRRDMKLSSDQNENIDDQN